ncbi:hypothetical protein OKA05_02045 [Luteolibacter arcticus]|uniref:Helix-turn-helix domain-containing protein n=1 Tax=Luteolibacter arcticus TaxID=1581411 RepID=A0ABT3GCG2_9BACT|nr:hypothetical protein [Luteolibacter arcticus]MCW1921314.1 hypothetical protein [Luteolibacter arcticus]
MSLYPSAWENRQRVPVTLPDEDDDEDVAPRPERSAGHSLRKLLFVLLADRNTRLGVECMALVTGIGYDGSSMADIASRHGVTRASVSKRCIELCETFGLPPARAMRSVKNRRACKVARSREIVAS